MLLSNELLLILVVALILAAMLIFIIPRSDKPGEEKTVTTETTVQEYPDKQVKVSIDPQGFPVRVLRLPYAPDEEMRSEQDEFHPTTILLNVVVARQDNPDLLVTQFDPPLTLEMTYSPEVLNRARELDLKYPVYGFWDGCKWVRFVPEKHRLDYQEEAHPTEQVAGRAIVQLSKWSDPALGRIP
jgi:hypothetical protein